MASDGMKQRYRILSLGARSKIYTALHPTKRNRHNPETLFFGDELEVAEFLRYAGLTEEMLRERGEFVESTGYLKDRTEKQYQVTNPLRVSVFRSVKDGWDKPDGMLSYLRTRKDRKYTLKWGLDNHTWSAVSACMDAALRLLVGRLQVDQISENAEKALRKDHPVAAAFRDAALGQWPLPQSDEDKAQNAKPHVQLVYTGPTVKTAQGTMEIERVLSACFQDLPQSTFTVLAAEICCHDQHYIRYGTQPQRLTTYKLPASTTVSTISDQLRNWLSVTQQVRINELSPSTGKCEHCGKQRSGQVVVLDRLPPTLIVVLSQPITRRDVGAEKVFDDVTVEYRRGGKTKMISYQAVGAILQDKDGYFDTHWYATLPRGFEKVFRRLTHYPHHTSTILQDWWVASGEEGNDSILCALFFRMKNVIEIV